ncbi:MAG: peptidoglycan-binding protein [Nitrospira sp.]|nr:peptidoglycan-binding protein [Nitrospira sp.]
MNPVIFPLKFQMKRAEVSDLHQALSILGFIIVQGEKKNQRFGASTRSAVQEFQTQHQLKVTGTVDKATARALNDVAAGQIPTAPPSSQAPSATPNQNSTTPDSDPPSTTRRVTGTVLHIDGTPLKGLLVQAFHRRIGGEEALGNEALTDKKGAYAIGYALPPGLSKVDLFVRAFDDKNRIVAVSAILIGASVEAVRDLIVSAEELRGPSAFAHATETLTPQISGASLAELDANDVALMVRNTGMAREDVTAWIAAKRLAERTLVPHEVLYGLVRMENTASLSRLLKRSSARLTRDLEEAARTNMVSFEVGKEAKQTVVVLKQLAATLSASKELPGSLGRVLSTSSKTSAAQQRAFLQRYTQYERKPSKFWQSLRDDPAFGAEVVADLQFSIQLATLTANHPPLVAALRARGVKRSSETAALTREDWQRLISTDIAGQRVGTPPNIKGDTEQERTDNYISLLMERTALAFPTTKVTNKLRTMPVWRTSTAVAFLDANPAFNLATSQIDRLVESDGYITQPEWDRKKLVSELSIVQRVMRLAPKGQDETVVNGLLTNGYQSAFSILRKSQDAFVRQTTLVMGGDTVAKNVYRNAQFQTSRAMGAFSLMHPSLADPLVSAVGALSSQVSDNATWSSLFGDVDYCACEHCRSIYSPAAYLVDLLAWLDTHELDGRTAFEQLDARRPDIKRIELSCDNTNTVLPYVDLVTEILEDRVLSFPTVDGAQVPTASTATSAELFANPESLHTEVYDEHLAKEVYPWVLPFDLWGELGRVYFEHLGVRRSDLMEALARQNTPSHHAISAERLRLSSAQWRIVTGADNRPVWKFWGYGSENPKGMNFKSDLAVVSKFLDRADCEYEELLDLLHSRVANPNHISIVGDACNTDDLTLETVTDSDLDKMQRFLRLWRNRGWSILNMDKVLYALNPAEINAKSLHALADLDRIQARTKASLLDIACWWAVIDTFEDRPEKDEPVQSLYQQVFLNRAVDPAAEEEAYPLALNEARTALRNTITWDEVRTQLLAALRVDDADLSLLVDETIDGLPNPQRVVSGTNATLEDLSALYRHVSFARTLKLNVEELLGVLDLTGLNPFNLENTDDAVELIDLLADVRASGFSLDELHYLHEHDLDADTRVGVTDEAISQTLIEIRDGLITIENEFIIVADPNGDVTTRYLGMALEADAASAVVAALQTEADGTNNSELAQVLIDNLSSLLTFDAETVIAQSTELRYNTMVGLLVPYLKDLQSKALVIEKTAIFAGRALDSIEDLLTLRVTMTVEGSQASALIGLQQSPYIDTDGTELLIEDDAEAFAALRRLFKTCLVLNKLAVDIDEQLWLFDVGVSKGLLNPVSLPTTPQPIAVGAWTAWINLVDLFWLRKGLPGGEPSLVELLQLLAFEGDAPAAETTFKNELSARTGWTVDDISTMTTAFGLRFPEDWFDGQALNRLVEAFKLIGRIGVAAMSADPWVAADIDMDQAEALRLAAKSKHDESQWPTIARGLRDPVRELQRAALVAYLMATSPKVYDDENALYSDLLIDVEMAPCMLTSRIKQAISSVQLFIQRTFLNLEEGVEFTRTDRDQWEWMKNYRVWEANRKVFLYPENWIEPELRISKSQLFEQLENSLLQGEVTDVSVEKAYMEYLEGLLKIGRLEVMGIYHQFEEDEDGTVDILHVVARTKGHPREYYYRQWVDEREWTPWEKLDADIEAEHVIVAIWDRRLYVFWPTVVQKAVGTESSTTNFFEMKLAWIERLHGQWGARKLSVDCLKVYGKWDGVDFFSQSESGISSAGEWLTYFRIDKQEPLTIECHQAYRSMWDSDSPASSNLLGRFVLNPCSGTINVDNSDKFDDAPVVAPMNNIVQRMRFFLTTGEDNLGVSTPLTLMKGRLDASKRLIGKAEPVDVLGKVPAQGIGIANDDEERGGWFDSGTFGNFIYPHQYGEFASQHGVFLDDNERTFHVMPEQAYDFGHVFDEEFKDDIEPGYVGITVTSRDVFIPEEGFPEFESELPWDEGPRDQELPLPGGQLGSPATVRASVAVQDVGTTLQSLSNQQLQYSQNQLVETDVTLDPVTEVSSTVTKYRFSLFYHPYVCDFLMELRRLGVAGLLDPNPNGPAENLVRQQRHRLEFFDKTYEPTTDVLEPYPIQDIDFEFGGAYADYNWEIFFHAPFLIANRLSQNQRFEEARKWYHYIFDPTNRSDDTDPLRFWKIQPFYREADAPITDFLDLAASSDGSVEAGDAREQYDEQIEAWLENPFDPHAIARLRTTAYQKTIVMKYLDNLLAWGDSLFRQDTIESINEATQLYVLALELLGERPDSLPPRQVPVVKTFEQVRQDLADSVLNNPLVQLENTLFKPVINVGATLPAWAVPAQLNNTFLTISLQDPKPYFCIPPNDKLLGYWDTVEDRLFKIRHCMNIEGIVRQLPLFEPPIDPGMLVRARAAGVDVASALADLNAPLPHYRFNVMLQKAYALNQTVRGLGGALLGVLEKKDAEELAALRSNQEIALFEAMREVKKLAIDEAQKSLSAAENNLEVIRQRENYYQGLVHDGWLVQEKGQIASLVTAGTLQMAGSIVSRIGAGLAAVPRVTTGASGTMGTPVATADVVDGAKLAKAMDLVGYALTLGSGVASNTASMLGITSGYQRRAAEWENQLNSAKKEIKQIEKQIEAANVRVAMAERDLENHDRQIEQAQAVREFMESKFSNTELYQWMVGQISSLYFQSYQLAYDLAKQTERAYRHELALPDATFINFGYWDSLKKGLLAGERLQLDLERMDKSYLDNNRREYEITKHVSLAQLDPVALLKLQTDGVCEFSIPEALFDLEYPGHYLRRIKSASVSIPCVTGPYTSVPARLTLVSSRTRVDPNATEDYPFDVSGEDARFQLYTGAVQSIIISAGRDDAGLFMADHRDERYLPFEGSGAISDWNLTLTSAVQTFDWSTITDVVFHVRYTAREGGDLLREAALKSIESEFAGIPLQRSFSALHEFPTEWNAFLRPTTDDEAVLKVDLSEKRFPYFARGLQPTISQIELVVLVKSPSTWTDTTVAVEEGERTEEVTLASTDNLYGGNPSGVVQYQGVSPGLWTVRVSTTSLGPPSEWIDDLVVIATYQVAMSA